MITGNQQLIDQIHELQRIFVEERTSNQKQRKLADVKDIGEDDLLRGDPETSFVVAQQALRWP